ncbi:MAG TPA: response regulator transcription factor [Ignavibacteriaceae bacterium]|nr:response regulator transcription factor [Ignavibacteriaceae bacterium]
MKEITVVLVDDHKLVRAGIRSLLESSDEIVVVGEASNGREALSLANQLNPNIIFLDLAMPELNGLETAEKLNHELPSIKSVILSMYTDTEYIIQALKSGASGYLLKDSAPGELKEAINTVMKDDIYISRAISSEVINNYILGRKKISQSDEIVNSREILTSRQRETLQLIAEGNSTKMIAEKLFISVKTVETHRAQLMKKLGIYDIAGLVRYAIKIGLIFPER